MSEKQLRINLLILMSGVLSFIISLIWYYGGTYLNERSYDGGISPSTWGIPIVAIISFVSFIIVFKLLKIKTLYLQIKLNSKLILYSSIIAIITGFLLFTRYKIVTTHNGAFYKIDRWTGSTYLIIGTTERKVKKE